MGDIPPDDEPWSSRSFTIVTTKTVVEDLDALVKTGVFGTSRAEVAEGLMREALRHAVQDGWV